MFVSQVKVQREQFAAADAEAKEKTKKAEVRCRIHRISSDLMEFNGIYWRFRGILRAFRIGPQQTNQP